MRNSPVDRHRWKSLPVAGERIRIMGSQARWFEAKTGKATVEEIFNRDKDSLYHLGRVEVLDSIR